MIKNNLSIRYRRKVQLVCILCLFPIFCSAHALQQKDVSTKQAPSVTVKAKAMAKNVKDKPLIAPPVMPQIKINRKVSNSQIYLEHSETLSFDEMVSPDYQVVKGNVRFRHNGAYLYCDSAFYYQKTNSLSAFGNVHMEQGDSIFLYGARMYYDGNTQVAMVREKVRLENKKVTLFTDSLNYDRTTNIGYFFDGGLLINEDKDVKNELSSEYGEYSSETKIANFKNDVKLKHPKFVMTNQELVYNTTTGVATINCPTDIVADSGYVYSTKGWYDTRRDKSVLLNRSFVLNDHRRLTGDTLNYDKKNGIGEAFGNVELIDSTQQITLKGDYGYSEEKTQYALFSKKALMIEHSTKDTLYLHADSLITRPDSIYKSVTAYRGVRFYRSDIQGICDSLSYSTRDSILNFYYKPIMWSKQQQLSGEFMQLFTKNNAADRLHIQKSAMAIAQETDSLYNQLSGKDLTAYLDSGKIVRLEVRGNAETVYLPRDSKSHELIGLNRLEGSSLTIFFENEKMKKLIVWPEPKGKFYPLILIPSDMRYLKNFAWYNNLRPSSPEDVLREPKVSGEISEGNQNERRKVVLSKPVPEYNPEVKEGETQVAGKKSVGLRKKSTK